MGPTVARDLVAGAGSWHGRATTMICSARMRSLAVVLVAQGALGGCKSPPAAEPATSAAASTTAGAAGASGATAPAQVDLCAATHEIAVAGGRYDFVSVQGRWLSDDPRLFTSAVLVPGADECMLGTDEVIEEGEVWCTMHLPTEPEAIEGRYQAMLEALKPCFPATEWNGAADDRDLPGWVFVPTDDALARAELRVERPSGGAPMLILRFTSANNDFDGFDD